MIPNLNEPEKNNKNFINDHPLSIGNKSLWNQYFHDCEIWQEIEKDVRRTRNDINFFKDAFNAEER